MPNRQAVYHAINTERDYQEALIKEYGPTRDSEEFARGHTIDAYMGFMEDYLLELKHIRARGWGEGEKRGLDIVRKVAGLAVACMEDHGAPLRLEKVNGKNSC